MKIFALAHSQRDAAEHQFVVVTLGKSALLDIIALQPLLARAHEVTTRLVPYALELFASSHIEPYRYCPPLPEEDYPGFLIDDYDSFKVYRQAALDHNQSHPIPCTYAGGSLLLSKSGVVFTWVEKHGNVSYETDPIYINNILDCARDAGEI